MSFDIRQEWVEIRQWVDAHRNTSGTNHDVWMKDLGAKALLKLAYKSFQTYCSDVLSNPLVKVSPENAIPLYLYEHKGVAFYFAKQISEEDACLILKNELQHEALKIGLAEQDFLEQPGVLGAMHFQETLFKIKNSIHPNS